MKKALTIIELIIAIAIFGFGLLVVLNSLTKNLTYVKKIQLTTTATLIAKDQIAAFYNFRDSNNLKYQKWNYITGYDISAKFFEKGKSYKIYIDLNGYRNNLEEIVNPNFNNTRLYYKTGNVFNLVGDKVFSGFYYTYDNRGKATPYARWISLTGAYINSEESKTSDEVLKILSIVKYKHGAMTGEVVLESFVSNWK